jgi:protein CpxP
MAMSVRVVGRAPMARSSFQMPGMIATVRMALVATTFLCVLSGSAVFAAPSAMSSAPEKSTRAPTQVDKVEQRITALHAKLQILPAQQVQWDQFANVMRANARTMDETFARRSRTLATQTAVQNMESYADVTASHAKGMQDLLPAFTALYATMPDLQKRAADQVFRDDAHRNDARGRNARASR